MKRSWNVSSKLRHFGDRESQLIGHRDGVARGDRRHRDRKLVDALARRAQLGEPRSTGRGEKPSQA